MNSKPRGLVPGDLVMFASTMPHIAMRPGFGTSRADDLDAFMFRVSPNELGLVVGFDSRPNGRVRVLVAFREGIDSTVYDEDLELVACPDD